MRHSFFRIGIFFALLITMGATSVSASNAHHCLIGDPITTWKTTDNWSKSYEEFALTSPANTNWDEFCIYMWVEKNQTFAFNNHFFNPGEAKQVGPSSDQATLCNDGGTGKGVATDGTTNKWKYIGATGLVKICAAQSSGANNQGEWKPYVWVEDSKEIEILKGNKIMFYFGSNTAKELKPDWLYLSTTSTAPHTASERYHRLNEQKCSSYISVAYVNAGVRYYISDYDPWGGVQMRENAIAGSLYSIYKENNVDKIYRNVGSVPHFSTTTVNKTVGTVNSEIAATADNSIYGNKQVLYYYYTTDGGNSFTKFDPSNISSLAVGVYTVYALGWDGHILVRSDKPVTLNVGVTISLDANGGTNGNVTSVFATSGIAASKVASLPTKTGYTFNGFWTLGGMEVINKNGEWKADVSGYTDNSGKWICSAASTLYAHWTPNSYTVTLEGMEADGGPIDVDVTYDGVLWPLEKKHTKAHYKFLGYWPDNDDKGATLDKDKQLIDEAGNWIKNIDPYTGANGDKATWIYPKSKSLFAQWEEIKYTVDVAVFPAGAGSVQVNGQTVSSVPNVGYATHSPELTAVPTNAAWVFKEWQVTPYAHLNLERYSQYDEKMDIFATDKDQKLTAVFEKRYNLVGSKYDENFQKGSMPTGGMPGFAFGSGAEFDIHSYTADGDNAIVNMSYTCKLEAGAYIFEIHDRKKGESLGRKGTGIYVLNDGGNVELRGGDDKDKSIFFYPKHEGQYTFRITYMRKDGEYYYPTVTVERPHAVYFGTGYAGIDDLSSVTSGTTGGTLKVTTSSGALANEDVTYGTNVTYTPSPETGYTFEGFYTSNEFTYCFTQNNPWIHYNLTGDDHVYAKFVEKATTVTLSNDGHGKIQIDGVDKTETTVGVTTHRKLTAVPDEGYKFLSWTHVSGDDIKLSSTSTNPTTLSGRGAGAVSGQEVRANFVERWALKAESEGWGYTEFTIANITVEDGKAIGYVDIALPANTDLQFKMVDKLTSDKYMNGSDRVYYMTNGNSYKWSFATDKAYNCGITTAGAGTYRFIWNITDKTMSVIYPNFVIYRTGDQGEDSESATHTTTSPVESYDGDRIEQAIEFRMKVRELDKWYSLSLPFEVNKVCVWDNGDGAYYDIVPYYRTGGKFYTGHYIIRKPDGSTTNFAIEGFEGRDRWTDPDSPIGYLPSANTPYIIQWHDSYFLNKYISFFGDTNQDIPSEFNAGERPSENDVVNIFGNNTMHNGTVLDAYLLDKDYGPSGAWLRQEIGTNRTVLPFECFIRANDATTTRYRILRRGMEETDTPTALEQISNHQSPMTIRVYTITGVLIGEYNDCSFQDAAHRIATDYNEGIYILRSENESMKLLLGGK